MLDGSSFVFGTRVPESVLRSWQVDGKTHVVGLVELYAIVAAFYTWMDTLKEQRVICFADSWPVLDTLVKGSSGVRDGVTYCLCSKLWTNRWELCCGLQGWHPSPTGGSSWPLFFEQIELS